MEEKEQNYAKNTFDEVATNYDDIPFFKISAEHIADTIINHTRKTDLDVLDVACGTGNVVLACASKLKDSTFDAVDISEGMLAKAKENASIQKLDNINFNLQDITKLDVNKKYHVITCAYALFFLPNPVQVLKSLIALLRPNGVVIFTSFTEKAFAPTSELFLSLLVKYGSTTAKEYDVNDWKKLKKRNDIIRLCTLSFVTDLDIKIKEISYGMNIDEWWELFNNTGYKGMLMELSTEDYERTKQEFYAEMLKHADMDGEVELNANTYVVIAS